MIKKPALSDSDVAAILERVSQEARTDPWLSELSRSPSSPIAARIMRERGISVETMNEAFARATREVFGKL